jgi:hypothetical protein
MTGKWINTPGLTTEGVGHYYHALCQRAVTTARTPSRITTAVPLDTINFRATSTRPADIRESDTEGSIPVGQCQVSHHHRRHNHHHHTPPLLIPPPPPPPPPPPLPPPLPPPPRLTTHDFRTLTIHIRNHGNHAPAISLRCPKGRVCWRHGLRRQRKHSLPWPLL